jgi:hypothetical protein
MIFVLAEVEKNSNNATGKMHKKNATYQLLSLFVFITLNVLVLKTQAQIIVDTLDQTGNIIRKDARLNKLGKKMLEYNQGLSLKTQMVDGFRLLMIRSTDRATVMKLRTYLLTNYPDQKVYIVFESPHIKLKFGNFTERTEAEKFKKIFLEQKLVTGNLFIVQEKVEMKPADKSNTKNDD